MLVLNQKQPQELTLVAIDHLNVPKYVNSKDQKTTFSDKDHKIYLVLHQKTKNRRRQIHKALINFASENHHHLNVDVDSFIKLAPELKPEVVFETIYSAIGHHDIKPFSLKSKESEANESRVYNLVSKRHDFQKHFAREAIKTEYQHFARHLQDTPPNHGISTHYATLIKKHAEKYPQVKVHIINKAEAKKLGMGLFLGVNAGSDVEAQGVVLEYVTDPKLPRTGLVGKGITFDSGGYNLKPSQFLEGMKYDMSGAAIVLSSVFALAKAKAKANVVAIGLFTDNRIGHNATLPESVLTSMNGKTVEINNTDAEGRLVLADGITYLIREKKADRLVELSTLTGAIQIALGPWFTGAFTTNDELFHEFNKAAHKTDELIWRLPIIPEHLETMQASEIADLTNSEKSRDAGSSTAAAFLNAFAEHKPYLHLDIAATADTKGKRGTGVMVKTLFEFLNR